MKSLAFLIRQHRFRLLVFLFVVLAIALGMVMVVVEGVDSRANILDVEDGIWWSVTTMTGVGYGDVYPVTLSGRLMGMLLEVMGVVVFGLIVGHIAVAMFDSRDKFYRKRLFRRIDMLEKKIDRMERNTSFLVRESGEHHRKSEK